jgi:uncharacterized membrane protein
MIQRVQSIYLTFVVICAALYLNISFIVVDNIGVKAIESNSLTIVSMITAVMALVCVFMFKKRKVQMNICWAGIVGSTVTTTLTLLEFYNHIATTAAGKHFSFGIAFPFLMVVFFVLGYNGIKKDDQLVKSMDRLR